MNRFLINETKEDIEKYYEENSFGGLIFHYLQQMYDFSTLESNKIIKFAFYYYMTYNIHTQFIDFCLYFNYIGNKNLYKINPYHYEIDVEEVYKHMKHRKYI